MNRAVFVIATALALGACQNDASTRHLAPIPPKTLALMSAKGVSSSEPILMRSFKKESEIEVWKRRADGKYTLLKTYPMCRWSGQLGPKTREGDRQAPEGFYDIAPASMNPNSSLYLSFDLGYPNAYDRSLGRTGSHLMVHGSCSSRGCFAMTDEAISEMYAIAREAFAGGQRSFQFQSYPFRMTAENLARHRADPNIAFWKNLKEGSDVFEVSKREPTVSVASGQYVFGSDDPSVAVALAERRGESQREVAHLVANGTPAVSIVYNDGGGHQSFREIATAPSGGRLSLGDVSRPEALAQGPREFVVGGVGRPSNNGNQASRTPAVRTGPAEAAKAPSTPAPVP
jgi:murein L,D-transpeptidase YafK